jgi:hypothetical protein
MGRQVKVECRDCGSEFDENIQKNAEIEPISEKEYHRAIDDYAGKCDCGGKYKMKTIPRCPKCRSIKLKQIDSICLYD